MIDLEKYIASSLFHSAKMKQVALGVFYSEGGRLDKTLTSPFLEELKQAGEAADMESVGLDVPEYLGLKDCLAQNMHILERIQIA